jgi:tRNA/rRNA methyltransferase
MSQVNAPGAPRLCVVLVEPAGPINLGSVARLCANYAITDLRLVAPRCNPADPEARRMAVHGQTVLDSATHYPDLISALHGCRRVVATCGRLDHGTIPLHPPEQVLPWLLADHGAAEASRAAAALVFGREDRGLSNDELLLSQRVIALYTDPHYPSLNLSHAVAVVLHELERCRRQAVAAPALDLDPAAPQQLEDCLEAARSLLLETGFLLEHTAHARMAKVRALLQRALIRSDEVAMLRGMVRQLRWALRQQRS